MARRRTAAAKRQDLVEAMRDAHHTGRIRPGEPVPTVRELSLTYGLSPQTISRELKKLVAEGVLYTVPRKGTFMALPVAAVAEPLLLVTPPTKSTTSVAAHNLRLRIGFEERAAQLGATSLALPLDVALRNFKAGTLPPLAGLFDASSMSPSQWWRETPDVPCVRYSSLPSEGVGYIDDTVCFDDGNGGRVAAEHLIQQGHRRIAFLGLHSLSWPNRRYRWSDRRARGWGYRMAELGERSEELLFTARVSPSGFGQEVAVASEVARALIQADGITAVVGANDRALIGLFNELRAARIDDAEWPAVVGFDGTLSAQSQIITSIRLPWEQLGRTAAELLWDRHTGRLSGPGERREIEMTLIPRLSSTKDWRHVVDGSVTEPAQNARAGR